MQALQDVELTWSERLLREGEEKGMHKLLLLQLTYKFGELPQEFVNQLYAITDREHLAALSAQVLTAQLLDEIALSAT